MRITKVVSVAAGVAALIIGLTGFAFGRAPEFRECLGSGGLYHYFTLNSAQVDDPWCYQCEDFECHSGNQEGSCFSSHLPCGMTRTGAAVIVERIASNGTATFEESKSLRINKARGVVQLLDCKGMVRAQVPMTQHLGLVLED